MPKAKEEAARGVTRATSGTAAMLAAEHDDALVFTVLEAGMTGGCCAEGFGIAVVADDCSSLAFLFNGDNSDPPSGTINGSEPFSITGGGAAGLTTGGRTGGAFGANIASTSGMWRTAPESCCRVERSCESLLYWYACKCRSHLLCSAGSESRGK